MIKRRLLLNIWISGYLLRRRYNSGEFDVIKKYELISKLHKSYLIYHSVVLLLWIFRVINVKWIWWVHWILILIMIATLIINDELNEQVEVLNKRLLPRLISSMWMGLAAISGFVHSALWVCKRPFIVSVVQNTNMRLKFKRKSCDEAKGHLRQRKYESGELWVVITSWLIIYPICICCITLSSWCSGYFEYSMRSGFGGCIGYRLWSWLPHFSLMMNSLNKRRYLTGIAADEWF